MKPERVQSAFGRPLSRHVALLRVNDRVSERISEREDCLYHVFIPSMRVMRHLASGTSGNSLRAERVAIDEHFFSFNFRLFIH